MVHGRPLRIGLWKYPLSQTHQGGLEVGREELARGHMDDLLLILNADVDVYITVGVWVPDGIQPIFFLNKPGRNLERNHRAAAPCSPLRSPFESFSRPDRPSTEPPPS